MAWVTSYLYYWYVSMICYHCCTYIISFRPGFLHIMHDLVQCLTSFYSFSQEVMMQVSGFGILSLKSVPLPWKNISLLWFPWQYLKIKDSYLAREEIRHASYSCLIHEYKFFESLDPYGMYSNIDFHCSICLNTKIYKEKHNIDLSL